LCIEAQGLWADRGGFSKEMRANERDKDIWKFFAKGQQHERHSASKLGSCLNYSFDPSPRGQNKQFDAVANDDDDDDGNVDLRGRCQKLGTCSARAVLF